MSGLQVLVTGANGFVALETVGQLLEQGHSVIGTVRSRAKAKEAEAIYARYLASGQLKFEESLLDVESVSKILDTHKLINYVIHSASGLVNRCTDDQYRDVIKPAVDLTESVLEAIYRKGTNVKRVVVTSSFAAIVNTTTVPSGDILPDSGDLWPEYHLETSKTNPWLAYCYSKSAAEKVAWKFLADHKDAKFDLKTICGPMVIGPQRAKPTSPQDFATTNNLITAAFYDQTDMFQGGGYPYVDSRNMAKAHVQALQVDSPRNRFFLEDGYTTLKRVTDTLRKSFPAAADMIAKVDKEGAQGVKLESRKSNEILKLDNYTFEETINPVAQLFLEVCQGVNLSIYMHKLKKNK